MLRYRRFTALFIALFAIASMMLAPKPAQAAGTVTTCSYAALTTALSGGGLVDFNIGAPCTITLGGAIAITVNTTVQNSSNFPVTISGAGTYRIFSLAINISLSIDGMAGGGTGGITFTQGNGGGGGGGGAIRANAGGNTVTIEDVVFLNNGAISSAGGGAILSTGTLSVTNSSFSGNSTNGQGGAIYGGGATTITNSTFTSNSATGNGGAVRTFTTATITGSTFTTNNTGSGGGGIYVGGDVDIINTTFTDNTGGGQALTINTATPVDVSGSTFTNNNCLIQSGSFNDLGGNIRDAASTGCVGIIPPIALVASMVCVDEDLHVTITDGNGNFNITGTGVGLPMNNVGIGTHILNAPAPGPNSWTGVTVTELTSDTESINLGALICTHPQSVTVEFASPSGSANEALGIGTVLRVTTSDTNPTAYATTVTVAISGGTANVADRTFTGTITIPAGTAHNSLVSIASGVAVTDDNTHEADDTIDLTISAPTNASLGAQTTYTHTIINDETARVHANPQNASINETIGTHNSRFQLTIIGTAGVLPLSTDLQVDFTVMPVELGSALEPEDFTTSTVAVYSFVAGSAGGALMNVPVTIVDDAITEPAEFFDIQLASVVNAILPPNGDTTYRNRQTVQIFANDPAGYTVNTTLTTNISEPAGTTTFTIRLNSEPVGQVDLDFVTTDSTECLVSPSSFGFNNTNWNVAQTFTITAQDDFLVDGGQPCAVMISRNITTTAPEYIAIGNPANVNITVNDNDAPATIAIISGDPQSTVVNTAFGAPLVVRVQNGGGQFVEGATVTFTPPVAGTSAVILGSPATTDINGFASVTATANTVAGIYNVVVTSGAAPSVNFILENTADVATTMSFVQQPTNAVAGVAIAPAVTTLLTDTYGNPVSGTFIAMSLSSGTGVLSGTTPQMTNGAGIATFNDLTINLIGTKQLTANVGAISAISNNFDITAGVATNISYSQQPSNAVAGVTIAPAVTVTLLDGFGNPASGQNVTLSLSTGTGALSGTATQMTNGSGVATFPDLSINLVGSKNLTATAGALTVISNAFTITVNTPANISFVQQPSNATAGAIIAPTVSVLLADSFGNGISGQPVTLTLSTGTGVLSGTLIEFTDASGVAIFPGISIDLIGSKNLTATAGALNVVSNAFTITSASATNISYSQQPSNAVAGATIAPAVAVTLLDGFGNPISGQNVTLTLTTGTGVLGGTVTQATNASGIATFPDLSINLVGSKNLTATAGALTVISNPFTITVGAPAIINFIQQPSNAVAGATIAPAVTVSLTDGSGNPIIGTNITLNLSTGTGVLSGTLTQMTDGVGVATFPDLSINLVGGKNLTATAGALTVISNAFTITSATATNISFSGQPTDETAGVAISPAVTVTLLDGFGNPVSGQNVTLTLTTGTGALSGTLTQMTDGSGVATFPDLSINLVGGKNLTATAGALTTVSNPFTITANTPAIINFAQQPSNAVAGATIAPAVTVSLTDMFGNPIIGQNVTLTLSTGTGILSGTVTQMTDGSGVATFPDLSINLIGGKNLTATAGALNVISNAFTITSASATNISFSGQPTNADAGAIIAPAVTVTILDGLGNPVSGENVTLTLTTGTGVLSGTLTQMTDGAGVATFADLNINLIGSKNLTATAGALVVGSNAFIITAPTGSGSGLVIVSGNPQQTATSTAFALPLVVRVTDTFGNPVTGETVTFVATVGGGGQTASLSAPGITDINGETSVIATANGIVGAYTVDATLGAQTVTFTLDNLDPNVLAVNVACVDANLVVTIVSGSGNFDITATIYGIGMPLVNVPLGAYTFPGPETWLGITVTELGGDNEILPVGNVSCDVLSPTTNIPAPMDPNAIGCVLTANVVAPDAPDNTYCRVLMRDGAVVDYSGAVPQNLIDLGVIFAVDIYRLEGGRAITTFPDYTQICLSGAGRMFYLDARLSPRDITEMPTEIVDNMTCAWIPATGTLVLTTR